MNEQEMNTRLAAWLADMGRMWRWLAVAVIGLLLVRFLAPQMVAVTLYKLSLMPAAAWVGYRIDRAINETTRPHELLALADQLRAEAKASPDDWERGFKERSALDLEQAARDRYGRRTWIICAVLIAVAVGS